MHLLSYHCRLALSLAASRMVKSRNNSLCLISRNCSSQALSHVCIYLTTSAHTKLKHFSHILVIPLACHHYLRNLHSDTCSMVMWLKLLLMEIVRNVSAALLKTTAFYTCASMIASTYHW